MGKRYYVDSSVYLNLWQRETDKYTGLKLWKIASDFLQKIEEENSAIYYSGYLLKELSYVMGNVFSEKKHLFFDESRFKKLKADDEDYAFARKLEREFNFEISFFDCLHIVLTRKSKSILVTRDRKLLHFGKKYCAIGRPEEFL